MSDAARFAALWRRLGGTADPDPVAARLIQAYHEPHRSYHTIAHLRDCLAQLDQAPAGPGIRDPVEAGIWFHDLVYDPLTSDNEERSAEQAVSLLREGGVPEGVAREVGRLVLLTRHGDPPTDPAGRLICDIDLAVLGREPKEYSDYERQIRAEYAWVPESVYRAERSRLLRRLLARDRLFGTPWFQERYEAAARANLQHALARLAPGG